MRARSVHGRFDVEETLAVVRRNEADPVWRERETLQHVEAAPELVAVCFRKRRPRGTLKKRSRTSTLVPRTTRFAHLRQRGSGALNAPARRSIGLAREDGAARDRTHRGQRFAAESEAADVVEVGDLEQLARSRGATNASSRSARDMPPPSSTTRTEPRTPSSNSMRTLRAPASSAFSTAPSPPTPAARSPRPRRSVAQRAPVSTGDARALARFRRLRGGWGAVNAEI